MLFIVWVFVFAWLYTYIEREGAIVLEIVEVVEEEGNLSLSLSVRVWCCGVCVFMMRIYFHDDEKFVWLVVLYTDKKEEEEKEEDLP